MAEPVADTTPALRRYLAYFWYMWGASLCYWGLRTTDRRLFRGGVAAYARATRVWPAFAGAHARRGTILSRELNQHQEGIAAVSQAIVLAPEHADYRLRRGLIARFHGNAQTALEDLEYYVAHGESTSWREEAQRQIALLREELAA